MIYVNVLHTVFFDLLSNINLSVVSDRVALLIQVPDLCFYIS